MLRATSIPRTEYDLVVVGGGPAGACAALQAADGEARVALFDDGDRIGGQLIRQTHKFFGSSDNYSGLRGFQIASPCRSESAPPRWKPFAASRYGRSTTVRLSG